MKMPIERSLRAFALVAAVLSAGRPGDPVQAQQPEPADARLAAGWIGQALDDVARSARAVGDEFAARFEDLPSATEAEAAGWRDRAERQGRTTGFRTWAAGAGQPSLKAAQAALYAYSGASVSPERAARLSALEALVPVLRAAYRGFDFAWVYVTTADGLMLIYPYVPPDQAVNNDPPTEQVYYTAADFGRRAVGWTPPYLDLVGAGMMITASYPVFAGDDLLGVVSRDITLDELSASVLGRLTEPGGATALLVDDHGLAIGASDPDLQAEIARVNTRAGAAALFYRSAAELEGLAIEGVRSSAHGWVNAAVDRVVAGGNAPGGGTIGAFESDGRTVRAARVAGSGWFVILIGDAA